MAYPMQPSFAGGELSPSLWGRVDTAKYAVGTRTLKNMIVHPQGGASNRPGTFYVGDCYSHSKRSRGIPFVFSTSSGQAYCLEFSDYVIRVIQDGGIVESGGSPVEIVSPYAEADLPNITFEQSGDILYLRHPDYFPRTLSRNSHTSWTLASQDFADGPYLSRTPDDLDILLTPAARTGSGVAITATDDIFTSNMIGRPFRIGYADTDDATILQWGYGDIATVTDGQNATINIDPDNPFGYEYIYNPDFESGIEGWENSGDSTSTFEHDATNQRAKLIHGSGGAAKMLQEILSWPARSSCTLVVDFFQIDNEATVRVYRTGEDGTGETNIDNDTGISATGEHSMTFDTPKSSYRLWVEITTSGSSASDEVHVDDVTMSLESLASIEWQQPDWTEDTGYPSCCAFFEQRLYDAGMSEYPQDILGSAIADYNSHAFESPGTDADAFRFSIPGKQVYEIRWMVDLGGLLIGTGGGVHLLTPGGDSDTVTPTSKNRKRQSGVGSADVQPLIAGGNALYLKRGAGTVIELGYQITADGFTGIDISVWAAHRFDGYTIDEWAFVDAPEPRVFARRSDGKVLAMTYLPEQEVRAWTYQDFGGVVESVCAVPGEEYDELYLFVRRTVNGSTVRYIERMIPRDVDNPHFVDCGLSYSGASTDTFSGLDHLEGETVVGTADGSVFEATVSGGEITLDQEAEDVHVGLSFVSDLHTLPLMGSKYGRKASVPNVNVYLKDSRGGYAGRDEDNLTEFKLRSQDDEEDPTALVTDFIPVNLAGTYDTDNGVLIRNTDPIPITILAVVPEAD